MKRIEKLAGELESLGASMLPSKLQACMKTGALLGQYGELTMRVDVDALRTTLQRRWEMQQRAGTMQIAVSFTDEAPIVFDIGDGIHVDEDLRRCIVCGFDDE